MRKSNFIRIKNGKKGKIFYKNKFLIAILMFHPFVLISFQMLFYLLQYYFKTPISKNISVMQLMGN